MFSSLTGCGQVEASTTTQATETTTGGATSVAPQDTCPLDPQLPVPVPECTDARESPDERRKQHLCRAISASKGVDAASSSPVDRSPHRMGSVGPSPLLLGAGLMHELSRSRHLPTKPRSVRIRILRVDRTVHAESRYLMALQKGHAPPLESVATAPD